MSLRLLPFLCAFALVACSTDVTRNNPLDPSGTGPKDPGHLAGRVFVQGAASQAGYVVHVRDAAGGEVAAPVTGTDGSFITGTIAPGTYDVTVDVPDTNTPITQAGVVVLPGETTSLGLLTALLVPPDGVVVGKVVLSSTAETPAGIRVVLSRTVAGTTQSWAQFTDGGGAYQFEQVAVGAYEVRADRQSFTPDLATVTVQKSVRSTAPVRDLTLYPASAVVQVSVAAGTGTLIGAPFTKTRSVRLVMLAFGGVNEMRYSEQADFVEGGKAVPFSPYLAGVPLTLSAGEGPKTVYAQFRVVDATSQEEKLRTETYATTIVYDATPPELLTFDLAPDAVTSGGLRYLSKDADPTSVPLSLVVLDELSHLAGVKVVVEGADPTTVPYTVVSSAGASATYASTVSVSLADGAKQVAVQLVDAAGNESALFTTSISVDRTPPTASLALVGGATLVRSPNVALAITAFDNAVLQGMMLSSSATFTNATIVPVTSAASWQVENPTLDETKHVYLRVFDEVGNHTDTEVAFGLDTTPPTAPRIATAAASRINATSVQVSIVASSSDAHFDQYEVRSTASPAWTAAGAAGPFTFALAPDSSNFLQVRGRDLVGNVSDPDSLTIIEDSTPPAAPSSLTVIERSGTVTLSWARPPDNDVGGYKVYYGPIGGGAPASYTGRFANEGPSPINVGNTTTVTLTGLVDFNSFYVAVSAYDTTQQPGPNEGPLAPSSGQEVMPRAVAISAAGSISLSNVQSVRVEKGYAYLAGATNFYVVDVSNPASPVQVGSLTTGNYPSLELYDGHAYLWNPTAAGAGILVVDVRKPASPVIVSSGKDAGQFFGPNGDLCLTKPCTTYIEGLGFARDYFRFADGYVSIRYDNDPVCTQYPQTGASGNDGTNRAFRLVKFRVDASNTASNGALVLDTSAANNWFTCAHEATAYNEDHVGLAVTPRRVYLASIYDGVYAYKRGVGADAWTNPASNTTYGTVGVGQCHTVDPTLTNNLDWKIIEYCWNATTQKGCPDCVRGFNLPNVGMGTASYTSLVDSGDYLYLSAGNHGIEIIDTTQAPNTGVSPNVENAALAVGARFDGGSYGRLRVNGPWLYAANNAYGDNAVWVYDISNRASPKLAGSYFAPNGCVTQDIDIEGAMVYRACWGKLEIARASRGEAFTPLYTMTQGGFGTALAGTVTGTVGSWVTSWFGMFSAYDLHSTSAPTLFGTDNFQNQRTCLSCGASLLRYTFAGYETSDRFGYFFGKYEQNGPYDPAEFVRDPYLHVVSLGAIGSITEQGSAWNPAVTHIAQLPVGSTTSGAPSINLPQDVAIQGRWAYVTGQAVSGSTLTYAGSLLGKVFVGGPESTGVLPGSWTSWVDPTNQDGYRVTTWQRFAAVISGVDQSKVYFYDTCANAACNPSPMLAGAAYSASSPRGDVFAYGRYLFLGSMYVGSANLTGAGLGAKAVGKRNFELGVWTRSPALIDAVLDEFNALWEGRHCPSCRRRDVCPVPLEEPALHGGGAANRNAGTAARLPSPRPRGL